MLFYEMIIADLVIWMFSEDFRGGFVDEGLFEVKRVGMVKFDDDRGFRSFISC